MSRLSMGRAALAAAAWAIAAEPGTAGAEDLRDAWSNALRVNAGLQAQVGSAERGVAAARSVRLPQFSTFTFNSFLSNSPAISTRGTCAAPSASGTGAGAGGLGAAFPPYSPVLGNGQTDFPFSVTYATIPIYTFGRIRQSIDAAEHQQNAQATEISRAALDLKLTMAEAYIAVLWARRQLEFAGRDVVRLVSFARDLINRREPGLAIRSDELAAEVSPANALQVRTRWLDLDEARRLAVAKAASTLAEENLNVVIDRYRQQLSTYTEVLDAETRRVQELTTLDDANDDNARAFFRLRRAVGDI